MFNTVGQQIVHHQDRSAHVLHPDVGVQFGSLATLFTEESMVLVKNSPNNIAMPLSSRRS